MHVKMYNPKGRSPLRRTGQPERREESERSRDGTHCLFLQMEKNREVLPPMLISELGRLQSDEGMNFSNVCCRFSFFG